MTRSIVWLCWPLNPSILSNPNNVEVSSNFLYVLYFYLHLFAQYRQLSTHNPDKALAVISAAGWLSKEEYGDSNVFYRHDVSNSHVDPATKFIQESCIVENQADKHASNLKVC